MHLLFVLFVYFFTFQVKIFAELNSRSCSFLRTATSLTTIVPELAQLTIRSYRMSLSSAVDQSTSIHHRHKRFLGTRDSSPKATLLEQIAANAFKDMNFTKVAILILNNNETMTKLRQNIDWQTILRAIMQDLDYDKLGRSLYFAIENEFNLEYLTSTFVNRTHIDTIYNAIIVNETLPDWLITSIHPELNVQIIQQMFNSLKNYFNTLKTIISNDQNLDEFLFNLIQNKTLIPLENIVQKIQQQNPTTLDQLVEIILEDINQIVKVKKKKNHNLCFIFYIQQEFSTTTIKPPLHYSNNETTQADIKHLLTQCAIAIDSFGQTARMILKSLEHLYCTSVWE